MAKRNGNRLPPIHPGEILREEFLRPLGLSAHELAVALCVPATRINEIVKERRGISAATALRLSRYFGTTPEVLAESAGVLRAGSGAGSIGKVYPTRSAAENRVGSSTAVIFHETL